MTEADHAFLDQVTRFTMNSRATGAAYDIAVSLPADRIDGQSYPLLIALDANYSFGTTAETARVQALMGEARPIIVVGVGTSASLSMHWLRRARDYAPGCPASAAESPLFQRIQRLLEAAGLNPVGWVGHAAEFLRFLQDELLPRLAADYPIDDEDIGICGHSLGGAFLSYVLLKKARPFTRFILGSFGVMYEPEDLASLERAFADTASEREIDVYHGLGGAELQEPSFEIPLRDAQSLLDRLVQADSRYRVTRRVFEAQGHGSMIACLTASGILHHWPGQSFTEAAKTR